MPHKKNPISCENVSGLSRVLRANALASLENIPLWHERDISHSSVERIILPDSTTLAHYLTKRLTGVVRNLVVNEEKMLANVGLTGGLVCSGTLLLELVRVGVLRSQAYEWVQRNALRASGDQVDFKTLILSDADITSHLSAEQIESTFDLRVTLQHIDTVFARVFPD